MIKIIIITMFFNPIPGNSLQSPLVSKQHIAIPVSCDDLLNVLGEDLMTEKINRQVTPRPDQITHATIQCQELNYEEADLAPEDVE